MMYVCMGRDIWTYPFVVASSTSGIHTRHATHALKAGAQLREVNVSKTTLVTTKASEITEVVGVVIISSLILLVFVDPLDHQSVMSGPDSHPR